MKFGDFSQLVPATMRLRTSPAVGAPPVGGGAILYPPSSLFTRLGYGRGRGRIAPVEGTRPTRVLQEEALDPGTANRDLARDRVPAAGPRDAESHLATGVTARDCRIN